MRQFFWPCVTFTMAVLSQVAMAADVPATQPAKRSLIDYFLPMPVKGKLSADAWGAADVGPRDPISTKSH